MQTTKTVAGPAPLAAVRDWSLSAATICMIEASCEPIEAVEVICAALGRGPLAAPRMASCEYADLAALRAACSDADYADDVGVWA